MRRSPKLFFRDSPLHNIHLSTKKSNRMTTTSLKTTATRWTDIVEFPQTGAKSKTLIEDENCRYTLMALAAGMHFPEHANPRNATVNVIEGQGVLTLEGEEIVLGSGIFVFIPATAPHAIKAITNLAFLLTLSEPVADSIH
jgi:quercetin dioxygenase-like cupin family protein